MSDPLHPLSGVVLIETGAVLTSGLAGMLAAARKRLDLVGTYFLALVTAFGGGTVRDLLIDRRPFFWIVYHHFLWVLLLVAIAVVYSPTAAEWARRVARWGAGVDALGLALFTLSGMSFALSAHLPLFVAVLVGVLTGTFGGVLRDVLIAEVPELFRPGVLAATPAFLGCWVYLGLERLGLGAEVAGAAAVTGIVALRLVSLRYGLSLPPPHWNRNPAPHP